MPTPYGSWKSPITSDLIAAVTLRLSQVMLDGDDVYWIEQRPAEQGRNVIVRRTPDGQTHDVNPPPTNARTRVHEYGGGAFSVADGVAYFANYDDQRLHRVEVAGDAAPAPLSPARDLRYADAVIDRTRHRLIAVREDHSAWGEASNALVGIDLEGDERSGGAVLTVGHNFYSSPRLSPDGGRLAWLSWDHPNMPWDGTELWTADLNADGTLGAATRVAGGLDESIFQPQWSPDGVLHFVSDRTGWWNLYRWRNGAVEPLYPAAAEFGVPDWVFGQSTYGFASPTQIVCSYIERGEYKLARLDTTTGKLDVIDTHYSDIDYLRVSGNRAAFIGGSATEPASVVLLDLTSGRHEVLQRAGSLAVDHGYISLPRAIEFPTEHGLSAHAFYYAPANKDFSAPSAEKPPLLVKIHGGPTGSTSTVLSLSIQYWTSRGFAVLDVNYGGSTGYGRDYRRRLNGQWGIVDLDDTVNGVRYCVAQGLADPNRLCIDGGSAGGYTTLAALTFRDVFKAGASYFGVSDLEALARDTHKFESRYLDSMIGPYPERRDLYVQRSPIHFIDRLKVPLILFQGLEDKVVPPNQAQLMYDAVRLNGLPVAYVTYEGEQHGFRQARNIKHSLDTELYFYSKVFGFDLADPVEGVKIENLPER